MFLYSNTTAGLLFVESDAKLGSFVIRDAAGTAVECAVLAEKTVENGICTTLDASNLTPWSPDNPVLYTIECDEGKERFGHVQLSPVQNKMLLLNGAPIYLRGYIRGIKAHDHPNMTGGTLYDAACKNIRQAKKYGFNFVRFHSTVPTEEFVNAADELGLLIHMEIGFAYDYDEHGKKKNLSTDNAKWRDTIRKFRNHPSVAVFCIGNEMHNAGHYPAIRGMYEEGRALAPNKLIMDNSGWGEYDRSSADIFSQHIAYYFPFKHHRDMFIQDNPWRMNGSVSDEPLEAHADTAAFSADIRRETVPIRPTISHEALHYIDIPDYEAMNAKYDAFAAKVGEQYLKDNGIEKPRFLTALPALVRQKGLTDKMPDYITGSRRWKLLGTKVFLERMRLSGLCGYEMLQLSDCLKYENKNGIIDCFDDDKGIDPKWMRTFNDDLVLLADFDPETYYEDERPFISVYASDFLPKAEITGDLTVTLDGETLYVGKKFVLGGGLQKLIGLTLTFNPCGESRAHTLKAEFVSDGITVNNEWTLWTYPRVKPSVRPEMKLQNEALKAYLDGEKPASDLFVTDTLDETVFDKLAENKTVLLFYEYKAERNAWQLPGALERFKPCIWDRGSNLGGIVYSELLQKTLASGRYFDLNMQPLLEAGTKVNLDHFPATVNEFISGIDKPVRDRMKGLISGVKDFLPDDTLRRFSHLFSVKVDGGTLIVCTLRMTDPEAPTVSNLLTALIDHPCAFAADNTISAADLRAYLEQVKAEGLRPEDVMNHFWEIDNKPVEDTLYWEEVGINMAKSRDKS